MTRQILFCLSLWLLSASCHQATPGERTDWQMQKIGKATVVNDTYFTDHYRYVVLNQPIETIKESHGTLGRVYIRREDNWVFAALIVLPCRVKPGDVVSPTALSVRYGVNWQNDLLFLAQ